MAHFFVMLRKIFLNVLNVRLVIFCLHASNCTHLCRSYKLKRGFTLLETIIYLALFSILLTGVLVSSYSFFRGAELMSARILRENETAFTIWKIGVLLNSAKEIISPQPGSASSTLRFVTYDGGEHTFMLHGETMMYATGTNPFTPLTADRVRMTSFIATLTPKIGVAPLFLEYILEVGGETVGPIRIYFTF